MEKKEPKPVVIGLGRKIPDMMICPDIQVIVDTRSGQEKRRERRKNKKK